MSTEICESGVCLVVSELPNDLIVIPFDTEQLPCSSASAQLAVPEGRSYRRFSAAEKELFPQISDLRISQESLSAGPQICWLRSCI